MHLRDGRGGEGLLVEAQEQVINAGPQCLFNDLLKLLWLKGRHIVL